MMELLAWWQAYPLGWAFTLTVFALAIGSFLNVLILRLPVMLERQWRADCAELLGTDLNDDDKPRFDLLWPGSTCPHCGHRLRIWENIPLLSYLLLRGRCAACQTRLSWQYPLVELTTAVLTVLVGLHFGPSWPTVAALLLTWGLIGLAVIDLRTYLLPDSITLPLLWLGLLVNWMNGFTDLESSLLGAVGGYLSLRIIFQLFKWVTGKEGMGYGDFKLLALLGAWLGWQTLPLVLVLASFTGAIMGITLILFAGRARAKPIPFGPFLAIAGWLGLLYGDTLNNLYLRFAGLA